MFSGAIPRKVEALNFDVIDLSENKLTETIPDDLGKLTKLTGLALFLNQLSGEVPSNIGRISTLKAFKLFNNNLSGELPPDLGRYSTLESFEVSSNLFTGRLPEHLCANGVLVDVVAHGNNLTGELPNSLGNCKSLSSVRVRGNRLSGNIPSGLWTSVNLTVLMINDNSFTGQLPDKVARQLSRLQINDNQFSGEIPAEISSSRNLTIFMASNNLLNDSLMDSLTILNLSGNLLSGQILAEIGSCTSLMYMDLSGNEFWGQIPPQISLLRLTSLNLSSNHLTGRIPVEFENAVFGSSFLNNPGLCASNPSLGIDVCSSWTRTLINKISSELFAILITIAATLFVLIMLSGLLVIRYHGKSKHGLDLTWKFTPFVRLNFSESNISTGLIESNVIGSGGSGKVYHVAVNDSGECVAVKRIWNNRKLEEKLEKEFLAEVEILGTIRHTNIVKLLCCMSKLVTGREANYGDENTSLAEWAWHHIQKGNPIVDALDVEIKEPCYLDKMIKVFELGIFFTGTLPLTRPTMKQVLQFLLPCNQPLAIEQRNGGSEYDAIPFLNNSNHSSMLDYSNGRLALSI
ncbi:hypothetical protein F0562_009600 [Nyssa sinensis]|uniref:Protein kinase domain-containing protein n=1 Tax=Nyssa sinensis TaxID=561372 RepID=A0A5J5A1I3_9ASTE|nr:hypothetical protein F0562_009600 [Nyssa sinensis]